MGVWGDQSIHEERNCPACHGSTVGRWDRNEGRCMPCGHCDGSGSVVTCLGCACDVSAPEAEEMGAYCARCRKDLDRPEAAE